MDRDELAALRMQAVWRGKSARTVTKNMEYDELVFIGMTHNASARERLSELEEQRTEALEKSNQAQGSHYDSYLNAKTKARDRLREDRGPDILDAQLKQGREWIRSQVEANGSMPSVDALAE